MQLFDFPSDPSLNLLPSDGIVYYYGKLMTSEEAGAMEEALLNRIEWRNDEAVIYGKRIITKRKVAWYGDQPFSYTYSKTTKTALAWTPELLILKNLAEKHSGETYNSCLLNLYHNGSEGMASNCHPHSNGSGRVLDQRPHALPRGSYKGLCNGLAHLCCSPGKGWCSSALLLFLAWPSVPGEGLHGQWSFWLRPIVPLPVSIECGIPPLFLMWKTHLLPGQVGHPIHLLMVCPKDGGRRLFPVLLVLLLLNPGPWAQIWQFWRSPRREWAPVAKVALGWDHLLRVPLCST
jgi:hypothetical protein